MIARELYKILVLSLLFLSFFIISCEGNENLLTECEEGYHWNSSSQNCERLYFSCNNNDTLCKSGFICNDLSSTCIEGCRENIDCNDDKICFNNKCENIKPKIKISSNSLTL